MAYPALSYRPGSPIGEIVIDQPLKRNAISADMWSALVGAVGEAQADPGARLIVVRGEGEHFAAGADITEFEAVYATAQRAQAYTRTMLDALAALENCTKPTLARISGACIGGGCSIALACDLRFADETARLGITPGKLGLVYSLADTRRLIAAVGRANAIDLLLTGRLIAATEARAMHLVNELSTVGDLQNRIDAFAALLSQTSSWSAAASKAMLRLCAQGADDNDPDAMALLISAFTGDHFQEGYQAFLERRPPVFPD